MLETLPLPEPDAQPWALFLDVDGTLLELAEHPNAVVVPEDLPGVLWQLRDCLGGAMALVSGRSLQMLDDLFGLTNLDCAGCHGAELRIGGAMPSLSADGVAVGLLANRLINETFGLKNVFVEIKSQSVALHYRPLNVDPADAVAAVTRALAPALGQFRILRGKNVIEAVGTETDKGIAVARFLRAVPYRDRTPVFIGDDVTDEAAFQEVNRRGGISIRVGDPRDTVARFHIDTVEMTAIWLRSHLLARLRQIASGPHH